jgi:hypothetical protein
MVNAVANVVAGKPLATGGALRAPLGTAVPVDTSTALNAAFKALGYVGEDGVRKAPDRTTSKTKAWGGDIIKVLQTEYSETWKLTLVESLLAEALKTVYGDLNVTTTAATVSTGTLQAIKSNGDILPNSAYIFEMREGVKKRRIVLPNAQVFEVGEIVYNDGSVIAYPVTLEAYEDSSGNNSYEYTDDGVFAP